MPPPKWTVTSDTLILHGRRICKPRPLCEKCAVRDDCNYYRATMGAVPKKKSLVRRVLSGAKKAVARRRAK
jgi:adenine-specific DNA glycosylase